MRTSGGAHALSTEHRWYRCSSRPGGVFMLVLLGASLVLLCDGPPGQSLGAAGWLGSAVSFLQIVLYIFRVSFYSSCALATSRAQFSSVMVTEMLRQ